MANFIDSSSDYEGNKEFSFTFWDFAVFIAMLVASSSIGIYFAYKVSSG